MDSASGVVLDIDGGETFTIEARDASGQVLQQIVITAGDEGTGDGMATPWSFSRASADVASVRFEGVRPSGRFGLGFDNFTTCAPDRVTSTEEADRPTGFLLRQNYPNPFNPATTIPFTLSETTHVRLVVYDVLGRQVTVLADRVYLPGSHAARFEAPTLPSGLYAYRVEAGAFSQTRTMLLVK